MFYVVGQNVADRKIEFEKIISNELSKGSVKIPAFFLARDHFDDYTYKTSFRLYYVEGFSEEDFKLIGDLKILKRNEKVTVLNDFEISLSSEYCSVGDSIEYYLKLKKLGDDIFKEAVRRLNDVFIFTDIFEEFKGEPGFDKSLLRNSSTKSLLENRDEFFEQLNRSIYRSVKENTHLSFSFGMTFPSALEKTIANFRFSENDFGRINVIIGKNGSGKSTYLSWLGLKLSQKDSRVGVLKPEVLDIRRVILISYSMFDTFERIQNLNSKSYILCGFIDKKKIEKEKNYLVSSVKHEYRDFVNKPIFGFLMFKSNSVLRKFLKPLEDNSVSSFSSGQLIIMKIILDIVNNIQERSIVLIDEIENHLHPNYVVELLRMVAFVLGEFNSFCILTTHSPLVVQQIDLNAVHVFDREGSITRVRSKRTNYLSMNLDSITDDVFGLKPEDNIYFDILKSLSRADDVEDIFNPLAKSLMRS